MIPISSGIHPVRSRCNGLKGGKRRKFFVANDCHPQTIALVQTRGSAINLDIVVSYWNSSLDVIPNQCFQPVFPTSISDQYSQPVFPTSIPNQYFQPVFPTSISNQ